MPPAEVPIGVPAELLRRRPDIRRAERDLAAATARVGMATADLYPRFSLTGTFSLQSSDIEQPAQVGQPHRSGSARRCSGRSSTPGRFARPSRSSDAQQEQALVRYEQTVLQALEEVHDALAAFITEQDRRKSLQAAVKANQESAELAEGALPAGPDGLHERAGRRSGSSTSRRRTLLQSETAVTTSLIALYKALGGGWEIEPCRARTRKSRADAEVADACGPWNRRS